ncbi:MAG: tRNA pseudouridine(55) synthase TruB [Candidatus Geothermincolia bacterium]
MPADAVLTINKPGGMTSRQVAARVGRVAGAAKAGHAGTLDPLATGVLVVCVGRATLLTSYLAGGTKVYRVGALLGVETNTYDTDGQVMARADASAVTADQVLGEAVRHVGTVLQVPPPFSAVKSGGKRLYEYARSGADIPAIERTVTVDSIVLVSLDEMEDGPVAVLDVTCGPGTYVRSLVHDMGEGLGCGACVSSLERTRSGMFVIEQSVRLEELENSGADSYMMSLEEATASMATVTLTGEQGTAVTMGKPIPSGTCAPPRAGEVFRVLDSEGRLLALYGPPRPDDGEEIAARAVRVFRPHMSGHNHEAA